MIVAVLLGLGALFGYVNERYLRLQPAIGLMLLALTMTVALILLGLLGLDAVGWDKSLVEGIDDRTPVQAGIPEAHREADRWVGPSRKVFTLRN